MYAWKMCIRLSVLFFFFCLTSSSLLYCNNAYFLKCSQQIRKIWLFSKIWVEVNFSFIFGLKEIFVWRIFAHLLFAQLLFTQWKFARFLAFVWRLGVSSRSWQLCLRAQQTWVMLVPCSSGHLNPSLFLQCCESWA